MRSLIVVNPYSKSESLDYKVSRLIEEMKKRNIESDVKTTVELKLVIDSDNTHFNSELNYDFCIYLDKDIYVASSLERQMPVFNTAQSIFLCDDKVTTFLHLQDLDLNLPRTIGGPLCFMRNPSKETIKNFLDEVEKTLGYPLIAKESFGSLGRQVYLIKNRDELNNIYNELMYKPHLYQEFIKTSVGKDLRVFVVGDKVVATMLRQNDHDFRSNVALGGHGRIVDIPESLKETAVKIAKRLDLLYCGIDFLFGENNTYYLAEVNSNAFFKELEIASKTNIAESIVLEILNRL